jgi:hypothetical protein
MTTGPLPHKKYMLEKELSLNVRKFLLLIREEDFVPRCPPGRLYFMLP